MAELLIIMKKIEKRKIFLVIIIILILLIIALFVGNFTFSYLAPDVDEVVNSKGTVLIDFWATWCGPCRMLSPIVDDVAATHPELKVGKVNIDEQPDLANQFNVMSIPTLIVFKDGQKVNESVGLVAKEKIEELIK